ncbi:hypothetical protein L873DRAFT_1929825 [Choiromyces venosus 120613-1]|uniref:Uncharacterized protein n=1 Tax=Choiromyces venosus 120613-1 TaxID=1336337 RepID=A0A3N4JFE7_9PEZI|nr:hypothetical protein L873DRAFT_1929825 [Choiromyces venosus 120613-1]
MPPRQRVRAGTRGTGTRQSARLSSLNTRRNAEFVVLRSPENITDVDPDTEGDEWEREYRPDVTKKDKPTKWVTRSKRSADDVDLEDYSPRGPSRKRRAAKIESESEDQASPVRRKVSSENSYGPSSESSEDGDDDTPRFPLQNFQRSSANNKAEKAKARDDANYRAPSTRRKSVPKKIKSTQQKNQKQTASYEAKTAERVAEIAAKKAPHLVALARIDAETEELREQLRMKKREREVMEQVFGVVSSKEKSKAGAGKSGEPETTVWLTDSETDGPIGSSSSNKVRRKLSLLRNELQEESDGWNSLFDESEKMSGVDSRKADKDTNPQPRNKVSADGESQIQAKKGEGWFEENTDGGLAEKPSSKTTVKFPATDIDSLFDDLETHPGGGSREKFTTTPEVPRGRPKGFGFQSRGRLPAKRSLRLQDENKTRAVNGKRGGIKEGSNHLSNWQMLRDRVERGRQVSATSSLDATNVSEIGPTKISVKHLSPKEAVGRRSESLIPEAKRSLGAKKGLERLDGKKSTGGTEDELERVNEEIGEFLKQCDNGPSLPDHQKGRDGYDVDLFDPLPEMPWWKLIGVDNGGDSPTVAAHARTNPMHPGLGVPERELEMVQKQLEKDLDFMDWDKAEAEFLKFDDDAILQPAIENPKPKNAAELKGTEEGNHSMKTGEQTLKSYGIPQKPPRLPQVIPEKNASEEVLTNPGQEEMLYRLDGKNNTLEENDQTEIDKPKPVHDLPSYPRDRLRRGPYTSTEIASYQMASLFQTYKEDIEKTEKNIESADKRYATENEKRRSQPAQELQKTPLEKPKADVLPDLHRDEAHESKVEDDKLKSVTRSSDRENDEKKEKEDIIRDVRPSLESGEIIEEEKVEGIAGTISDSTEWAEQKERSCEAVSIVSATPLEDGEIVEAAREGFDHDSPKVYSAELPESSLRHPEGGSDERNFMTDAINPYSTVLSGKAGTIHRVELPDGSMGYVFAEKSSRESRIDFMIDGPSGGYERIELGTSELDSEKCLPSEVGGEGVWGSWGRLHRSVSRERAWQSSRRTPQSSHQDRMRGCLPDFWPRGARDVSCESNVRPVGRWSQSPAPRRDFHGSSRRTPQSSHQDRIRSDFPDYWACRSRDGSCERNVRPVRKRSQSPEPKRSFREYQRRTLSPILQDKPQTELSKTLPRGSRDGSYERNVGPVRKLSHNQVGNDDWD